MKTLETINLGKSFDGIKAVSNLQIGLEQGRVTALIGPNGAGKTTAFHLMSGFVKPETGSVHHRGCDITKLPPWQIAARGVVRLFQEVRVFEGISVLDNILTAIAAEEIETPLAAIIFRFRVTASERQLRAKAEGVLEYVGLQPWANQLAGALSFGQQKLLAIARLIAMDPDVILLDEPAAGISPAMLSKVLVLIRSLADSGKTIGVIEHNMNVVLRIADWVYFMNEGEVFMVGSPLDVLSDPEIRTLYMGFRD